MEPKELAPSVGRPLRGDNHDNLQTIYRCCWITPARNCSTTCRKSGRRWTTASTSTTTERAAVRKFLARLENGDPTEIQADYVQTFDLTPEHSLHLTHHLFGDDKNRGPALIDLSELYKDYGVEVASNELPDYLPLILEFVGLPGGKRSTELFSAMPSRCLPCWRPTWKKPIAPMHRWCALSKTGRP